MQGKKVSTEENVNGLLKLNLRLLLGYFRLFVPVNEEAIKGVYRTGGEDRPLLQCREFVFSTQ